VNSLTLVQLLRILDDIDSSRSGLARIIPAGSG